MHYFKTLFALTGSVALLVAPAADAAVLAIDSVTLNPDNSLASAVVGGVSYDPGTIGSSAADNVGNEFSGFPYAAGTPAPAGGAISGPSLDAFDNNLLTGVAGGAGGSLDSGGVFAFRWLGGSFTDNDSDPDFFVFEDGGNDTLSVQAILMDGTLGTSLSIASGASNWNTVRTDGTLLVGGNPVTNRSVAGTSFAFTDQLDASGNNLTAGAEIQGILIGQINTADFYEVYANVSPIPEPGTAGLLLGAVALGFLVRRRRRA